MLIFVFVEFLTKVQMKSNELCFIRRNVIYFKHGYMTNKGPTLLWLLCQSNRKTLFVIRLGCIN